MSEQKIQPFDWSLWFMWIMATTLGWILGRFLIPNLAFVTIGLATGILQWFVLQRRISNSWRWILVTTFGWVAAALLILLIIPDGADFASGVLVGLLMGTAQWFLLRREVHWSGWWIVMNIVGWTTGMALLPGIFLTGMMAGLVTGTALALLLRYPRSSSAEKAGS